MTIPHMSIILDSQTEGFSRHKRTLLAGYEREKVQRREPLESLMSERHTSNNAYGKKNTVKAIKY
jgi:hypothetical protein